MPIALITGATGQDGSYLTDLLAGHGWEVHGLVRDGDPHPGPESPLISHRGSLTDVEATAGLIQQLRPDQVYNLAGMSSVAQSWAQPLEAARVNGAAVVALLDACWKLKSEGHDVHVVQASSAEMFGEPTTAPQDEDTPIRPTNPYGAAKAFAHHSVGVFRARGLHASSLILYNHESPRRPPTFVTRKITQAAARIARGSDDILSLGNLDARRDWGWAPDYVQAMWLAASLTEPDDYVIATGQAHSVRDFVAAAFAEVGIEDWEPRVRVDPAFYRPIDSTELVGNAARAQRKLGWRPQVGFTELVARMVAEDLAR